jgi:ribosomal protein L19
MQNRHLSAANYSNNLEAELEKLQVEIEEKEEMIEKFKGGMMKKEPSAVSLEVPLKKSTSTSSVQTNVPSHSIKIQAEPVLKTSNSQTTPNKEVEKYRLKMQEFQRVSVLTSEEIMRLRDELDKQNRKLEGIEHLNQVNVKLDSIENRLNAQDSRSPVKSMQSTITEEGANLQNELYALLSQPSRTPADVQKLQELLATLGIETSDANKERYISELKERNKLLLKVSQQLDSKLGISTSKISTFSHLKQTLVEKMELVMSLVDLSRNMNQEKQYLVLNQILGYKVHRARRQDTVINGSP